MLYTQCFYHRDALAPLIWQLDFHSFLDPHFGRLHPEVEGSLIYVDNVCHSFVHEDPYDSLGELLLLMQ